MAEQPGESCLVSSESAYPYLLFCLVTFMLQSSQGPIILSPQSSTGATGELLHHTTNPCKPYSLLSGKGEIKQQRAYYCCVNYISTQENGRTFCCLSIGKNGSSDSQISQQNLVPVPTACIAQLSHSDQPLLFDQASQGNLSFHPPEILKANNLAKD